MRAGTSRSLAFRGNSWEWEAILSALTVEALIHHTKHIAENCGADQRRPMLTDGKMGPNWGELKKLKEGE